MAKSHGGLLGTVKLAGTPTLMLATFAFAPMRRRQLTTFT
jgi:hypothetical protein